MPKGFSNKLSNKSKSVLSQSSLSTNNHTVKIEQPGFFSNVLQGFGLGAGQSLAFNMFRSNQTITQQTVTQDIPFLKEYIQCMKEYNNNSDACKQYLEKDNIK
jgi:hypothetical protein